MQGEGTDAEMQEVSWGPTNHVIALRQPGRNLQSDLVGSELARTSDTGQKARSRMWRTKAESETLAQ